MLRPVATQGPFGRDFEAYYAAGATWDAGRDPWSRAIWDVERTIPGVDASRDELLPYVGPAAALPLLGAFARLPFTLAVRAWTALLIAAYGATVAAVLTLARTRRRSELAAALVFGLAAGPTISAIALGQIALVAVAGVACALVAYDTISKRGVAAGALATLAAGLQPNVAVALLARMRDGRALLCATIGATGFAALTLAAGGGIAGFARYLHRLAAHAGAERFSAIQHTPAAIAYAFGTPETVAASAGTAIALVTLAAIVAVVVRAPIRARDATLLAIAALPLAVPFFHEHDFVVELIPLLYLALCAGDCARAVAGVAAACIFVDWFGLAQRPTAQAQILVMGVALSLAFAALSPRGRALRHGAPALAALILVACAALPLARSARAPTWPDALPAHYHAGAGDVSEVWRDEQQVAGLAARVPAWGALRAIPLAGCIVLGVAIVLAGRSRPRPSDAAASADGAAPG